VRLAADEVGRSAPDYSGPMDVAIVSIGWEGAHSTVAQCTLVFGGAYPVMSCVADGAHRTHGGSDVAPTGFITGAKAPFAAEANWSSGRGGSPSARWYPATHHGIHGHRVGHDYPVLGVAWWAWWAVSVMC
jgi:hypothetical protein